MSKIAVCTTFPNSYWPHPAKQMIESFNKFWPKDIDLYIHVDDNTLAQELMRIAPDRANIFINTEKAKDHAAFLERNAGRDDPQDYRKQALRFSHKPAAIMDTLAYISDNPERAVDCLIWLDADVITKADVTHEWLQSVLPENGCAYLGRKDWPHSECGFLGFTTDFAREFMQKMWLFYQTDTVFDQEQWDDSWLFDVVRKSYVEGKFKNLSADIPGNNVWPKSVLGQKMQHLKGPVAKGVITKPQQMAPLQIQTLNAVPEQEILDNIAENRKLIKRWVPKCRKHGEKAILVSAGTSLDPEEVRPFYDAGHRVIAVKHAIKRLVEAGITPWATILLDPREHVKNFVSDIPKSTIVFVASQCKPEVTQALLDAGLKVIGYHAPVNAPHVWEEGDCLIGMGSATATRGIFVLNALGFRDFELFGYDLCYFTKPDLTEKNDLGGPKYLEIEVMTNFPYDNIARGWWTEGQFAAQVQEMQQILQMRDMTFRAHGDGIIGWMDRSRRRSDLKAGQIKGKLVKVDFYEFMGETLWMRLKNWLRRKIKKA